MPIYSPNADGKHFLKKHDKNGDDRLDKVELKQIIKDFGDLFPSWRAHRALKYADVSGDGFITLDETNLLIDYMLKKGYVITK